MAGRQGRQRIKGLYARTKAGVTYFSFRHPITGKEVGLGTDRAAAEQAVQLVSRRLAPEPVQRALNKIERPNSTWGQHVDWFLSVHLPRKRSKNGAPLAPATLALFRSSLGKTASWSSHPIDGINRAQCVGLIESQPGRTAQILRTHLIQTFAAAVARGLRHDNPAEGTLRPDAVIQRGRLTHAAYIAVHGAAPGWLQRAMTLSLLSLQRPGDLCALDRACWDGTHWCVRQSKSEGAGYGLLRIRPHPELAAALDDCQRHPVDTCSRLLAYQPTRKKRAVGREHWAELSDEILSRHFAALRERLDHPDLTPAGLKPPSYYEIKALGARLYEEAGRPVEWIQALAGHQDAATTRLYTSRHREKWTDVDLFGEMG